MKTYSKHPFPFYISDNATKLIIGTIPPARFCIDRNEKKSTLTNPNDVGFYYGSCDNYFWELIGEVFDTKFAFGEEGVEQRKNFLNRKGIGITDMIEECERINNSSLDSKLEIIQFRKVSPLLKIFPNIKTLIYTSVYVKTLICQETNSYHSSIIDQPKKKTIIIDGKKYNVWILYSPSPTALRGIGTNGKAKRLEQYKNVFNDK
jgi:G:T/U-mismatch repair DNA glycosylase